MGTHNLQCYNNCRQIGTFNSLADIVDLFFIKSPKVISILIEDVLHSELHTFEYVWGIQSYLQENNDCIAIPTGVSESHEETLLFWWFMHENYANSILDREKWKTSSSSSIRSTRRETCANITQRSQQILDLIFSINFVSNHFIKRDCLSR